MNTGLYGFPPGASDKYTTAEKLIVTRQTVAGSATFDLLADFDPSTFEGYRLELTNILPNTDGVLAVRVANAGVADSSSSYFSGAIAAAISASATSASTGLNIYNLGKGGSVTILIHNAEEVSQLKTIQMNGIVQINNTPAYIGNVQLASYTGGAITGLQLLFTAGQTFRAGGVARLYGSSKA